MSRNVGSSSIQEKVLEVVSSIEAKMDEDLRQMDDENYIQKYREKRLQQLKEDAKARQEYLSNGHGDYEEIDEKKFYAICKKSASVVVHFYRNETPRCKIFDHHLKILAKKHLEARFVKLLADSCLRIATTYKLIVIPTLLIIKDNHVRDKIVGFTDLGNCDDFCTEMLEWRLGCSQVIKYDGDLSHPPDPKKKQKSILVQGKKTIRGRGDSDIESD